MIERERIVAGAVVPRWVITLVGGVALGGGLLLVPVPLWAAVGAVCVVVGACWPRTMTTWAAIGIVALGLLLRPADPGATALAVLVVHVAHVAGSLSLSVSPRALVTVRALRPTFRRFAVIQVLSQTIALAVLVVPTVAGPGWPIAAVIGAIALGGAVVVLVRAGERRDGSGRSGSDVGGGR